MQLQQQFYETGQISRISNGDRLTVGGYLKTNKQQQKKPQLTDIEQESAEYSLPILTIHLKHDSLVMRK